MEPQISPIETLSNITPATSFHFLVVFHGTKGIDGLNPIDIRFQKVSGIELSVGKGERKQNGGDPVVLANYTEYPNLVLERGYSIHPSPLRDEFITAIESLKFSPQNLHIILMNNSSLPIASWLFFNAKPVKWAISDLDATQSGILIETLELSYSKFQPIQL